MTRVSRHREKTEARNADALRGSGATAMRERIEAARANESPCVIPGCKDTTLGRMIHHDEPAVCATHAVAIWDAVEQRTQEEPGLRLAQARLKDQKSNARMTERKASSKPDALGHIYYVRVADLIKVGWSQSPYTRLRDYGPFAEMLVHYPATRSDEAELHRQLSPSRAKGREWYRDDDVLAGFVSSALAEHGPPERRCAPWTEPKQIVASKRQR